MNHTPTPWKVESNDKYPNALIYSCDETLPVYGKSIAACSSDEGKDGSANAAFIVAACNAHEEAMELLERMQIELQRRIISGGMETNVAESLGLDELLIDIEKIVAKAGVK